jgi:ribosome-associated protein
MLALAHWRPHDDELAFSFIRASGPGGQAVNKTSSAVQLRFDVRASRLPDAVKARLLASGDQRLNSEGVFIVKAQVHRSQEMNRQDAIERLVAWVQAASHVARTRHATRPTRGSQQRRLAGKALRGAIKAGRGRARESD